MGVLDKSRVRMTEESSAQSRNMHFMPGDRQASIDSVVDDDLDEKIMIVKDCKNEKRVEFRELELDIKPIQVTNKKLDKNTTPQSPLFSTLVSPSKLNHQFSHFDEQEQSTESNTAVRKSEL